MNRLFLLGFILVLGMNTFAQNIIKVRSKHSKELIHTMNNEEFFGRGESKIFIQKTNVGYEFITRNSKNKFNLYKNGTKLGEYSYPRFSDALYHETQSKKDEETLYTLHMKSGEKFGPYQYVSPYFSKENKLIALRYKENGKVFFKDFKINKTFGPFEEIYVQTLETFATAIEYRKDGKWHLMNNEVIYGPFNSVNYPYQRKASDPFYFTFQNESDEWQVYYKQTFDFKFTNSPSVTIFENDKIVINGDLKTEDGVKKVFLIDGKSYEDYYNYKSLAYNNFGDVLVLEANRESETDKSNIYQNNTLLGSYQIAHLFSSNVQKSSIYDLILIEKSTDPDIQSESYSVIKKDKITPIGTSDDIELNDLFLIGEDVIYIRKKDSVLVVNGAPTKHKKITYMDYANYPEEVFMLKKEGRFDVILKNEKVLTKEELKNTRFSPDWYMLKDKSYSYEFIDGKKYLYAKNSNKKIGPVSSQTNIEFSKDYKHYGESDERTMEVSIDGKLVSKGFNITYNPHANTFHWLSIEGKKMFLHSYQID